jgi:hypothetical protein
MTQPATPAAQPASSVVRVVVIHPAGNAKSTVELPVNVPVNRLVRALVTRLQLPQTNPGGQPLNYQLALQRAGSDDTLLNPDQTLSSAQVQNDDTLRLYVDMQAARA